MGEIHIIEQAVSAMKQQWGERWNSISTYDLTPQKSILYLKDELTS